MKRRNSTNEEGKPTKKVARVEKDVVSSTAVSSLETFISNYLFWSCYQDTDDMIKSAYEKYTSRKLQEDIDGIHLDFNTALASLLLQHALFKDVFLTSQSFVSAPSDPQGKSGQVALTPVQTTNQAGSVLGVNLISIFKVEFLNPKDRKGARRQVTSVHSVHNFQPVGPIPSPAPAQLALESFVCSTFFGTWVQDDEEVFEKIFRRDYSPDVKENDHGRDLTPNQFHDFIVQTRKQFLNRRLISQSCVVNVSDSIGRTGQVGHMAMVAAVVDGVETNFKVISVADLVFKSDLRENLGGHRQISVQSFVFAVVA